MAHKGTLPGVHMTHNDEVQTVLVSVQYSIKTQIVMPMLFRNMKMHYNAKRQCAHGGGGATEDFSELPFLGAADAAAAAPDVRVDSLLVCVEDLRSALPRLGGCCAATASSRARRGCSDEPRPGMNSAGERNARADAEGCRPARCTGEPLMATGEVTEPESGPEVEAGIARGGRCGKDSIGAAAWT